MPGFIIHGTGGPGPANTVETRRKHRWTFQTLADRRNPIILLLKEASRPNLTIEEPVMHHNQEQAYFAGKHSWESLKMVWYDGEQPDDVSKDMWDWVNIAVNIPAVTVALPSAYKKDAKLQMLDGMGSAKETWSLYGCWPQNSNWNTLDYESTDIQTIEVTMRYDRAERA